MLYISTNKEHKNQQKLKSNNKETFKIFTELFLIILLAKVSGVLKREGYFR